MKGILVIEDDREYMGLICELLHEAQYATTQATSASEAAAIIQEGLDQFAGILVDGCLAGNTPDTQPLIEMVKASGYTGPVVAMSGVVQYRNSMVSWGCTHQAEKWEASDLLVELLAQ